MVLRPLPQNPLRARGGVRKGGAARVRGESPVGRRGAGAGEGGGAPAAASLDSATRCVCGGGIV